MTMSADECRVWLLHIGIRARDRLTSRFYSMVVRLWLRAWGAGCGVHLQVQGWPIVRRAISSSLTIGSNCIVNSAKASNLAGMNRSCYICTLRKGAVLQIGDNCGFSATAIGAAKSIIIGDNVLCGVNTSITDTDWHSIPVHLRRDPSHVRSEPVVIEDNVWLSMHVTVLKGVHIGAGTIVAAGSVVSRDLPAGVIAGGIPARVLRLLTPEEVNSPSTLSELHSIQAMDRLESIPVSTE